MTKQVSEQVFDH